MEDLIDYGRVADVYDLYVTQDFDVAFYIEEAGKTRGKILELMCGTGRVSVPLIEAGADLTGVDASGEMLARLEEKLRGRNFEARTIRADVRHLNLPEQFDLAIIPFHSFTELVYRRDQELALKAIHGCLKEGGRLICTLHDPGVRARSADGTLRLNGTFPTEDGILLLSGFETYDERTGIVDRSQFYEFFDTAGNLRAKRVLPMRFALIGKAHFEGLANAAGFKVVELYGDYERGKYQEDNSPYMIWVLERITRR